MHWWKRFVLPGLLSCCMLVAGCASQRYPAPIAAALQAKAGSASETLEAQAPSVVDELQRLTVQEPAYSENGGVAEYLIGPGDILLITLWRGMQFDRVSITVRPDGKISFLFLENLQVSGLTPSQVDDLITTRLARFMRQPQIDVVVQEYNSKKVALFGEVNRLGAQLLSGPNIYPLKGKTTLLDLLLTAGGHTEHADLNRVEISRQGHVFKVDLYKALFQGEPQYNVVVQPGDRVVVPPLPRAQPKVFVIGEVRTPGGYTLERDDRVFDAISKAGGFGAAPALKKVRVLRYGDRTSPSVLQADMQAFLTDLRADQNVTLRDRDVVVIPRSFIGELKETVASITPFLQFLLFPAAYRDVYTTGGGLRVNTGFPPTSLSTTVTGEVTGSAVRPTTTTTTTP